MALVQSLILYALSFNGFGKSLLDYVLTLSSLDGTEELKALSDDAIQRLSGALENLKEKLLNANQLYVYKNEMVKKYICHFQWKRIVH